MDLSASQEVAAGRDRVWAIVTDPDALIARLRLRSLTLDRDPDAPVVVPGAEWVAVLDVKGAPRQGILRVTEVLAPERLSMAGEFDGVAMTLTVSLAETAPEACRVDLDVAARGRGIGGRVLLQTLRVMRPTLEAKLAQRLAQCAREIGIEAV